MASKSAYELHHNFPKLADESGFAFNIHRPRMHVDWNKIRLIDIDSVVRERKFSLIEQHVNDILNCVLESEFDVQILNEGVLKMFRLAQLAVEYQQFCRHYLDRSVYVLKEEISSLLQELDIAKKDVREKEEEIKKLRRKTKHSYRTPLPYGNDNIATMILKTLTSKSELFPSTSNADALQYNKCSYCDKVFLNQLYLKSHISRRHPNVLEIPQKDNIENHQDINSGIENNKLSQEIIELKNKLKEMEILINQNNLINQKTVIENKSNAQERGHNSDTPKKMKDAEVSTNNEDYLLDKIHEWKKEEHEKYNKELNLLRSQIMETINSIKEKEPKTTFNENNIIDQLQTTIREQGAEILALRQELNNSKLKVESDNAQRKRQADEEMAMWTQRLETQSKQYDLLVHRLTSVTKEAEESRAFAEKEKKRAEYLQMMLKEKSNKNAEGEDSSVSIQSPVGIKQKKREKGSSGVNTAKKHIKPDTKPGHKILSDRKTLDKLHQKAQELLNIGSVSSSSSDVSSLEKPPNKNNDVSNGKAPFRVKDNKMMTNYKNSNNIDVVKNSNHLHQSRKNNAQKSHKEKIKINKSKIETKPDFEQNGPIIMQKSPIKVIRAKITEEVNNRLVSAGMDPLKNGLPKSVFQKQKRLILQQYDQKSKGNPLHEKVRHSILAHLDSTISMKSIPQPNDYVSPNKINKSFSITSVLSNVKSKALSLVKTNDLATKNKGKALNAEVAKRAMMLLRTPPESAHSSPIKKNASSKVNGEKFSKAELKSHIKSDEKQKPEATIIKGRNKRSLTTIVNNESESESTGSDHKVYKVVSEQSSKSIDHLIKSPARRPASANADYNHSIKKYNLDNEDFGITRTQSAINVSSLTTDVTHNKNKQSNFDEHLENNSTSDDAESLNKTQIKKTISEENVQCNTKQTKSVLKNASSTSSLNKKKVLFDMDAIQMKSVSASPSQSLTEKSDSNEKYELGLINLDGEEWDISSIENEPLKNDTKIQINTRTSPKIAQLKQTIESQLARRNETPSTVRVGGVDVLAGPMVRPSSVGGSNTSLGSSILDDCDFVPTTNNKAFAKTKSVVQKDDSEIDLSEFSIDGQNKNESF